MILRQTYCDQFYSRYVNSNMTEVVVKNVGSHFFYTVFGLSWVNDEIIKPPRWVI